MRSRTSLVAAALAVVPILAAGAIGFTVAAGDGGHGGPTAREAQASQGLLSISFPSGWRRQPSPVTFPTGLSDEIALAPSTGGASTPSPAGILVVGRTSIPASSLLPSRLLPSLAAAPSRSIVSLAGATFYSYPNVALPAAQGGATIYAMPTSDGSLLGVCLLRGASSGFGASCERSFATIRSGSGQVLRVAPSPVYASGLDSAIQRLNTSRAKLGAQLLSARSAQAQVRAASALGAAYLEAAASLQRLDAGGAAAANRGVVSALRSSEAAYRALGLAAASQNSAAYRRAGAEVRRAAAALSNAYAQLDVFGYSVS